MSLEILSGVEAVRTSLWFPVEKVLVIGDIHLGYEESLFKQGFAVPRLQFKDSVKAMKEILKRIGVKPEKIIINGDLKHEFGQISDQEWFDTSRFLELLSKNCKKVVLVKGNHDTILAPIAKRKKLEIVDYFCFKLKKKKRVNKGGSIGGIRALLGLRGDSPINSVCVLHGDKLLENEPVKRVDLLIIGHDHPAIVLEEGPKREKYKCFLLGKYKKQKMIVMPSFLSAIEGMDIRFENGHSPYLKQRIGNFEVFIVGDEVYSFGKLKNL